MKIRKDIYLKQLEIYGYQYVDNLVYPSYQKRLSYGNKVVIIDIFVKDRVIAINGNRSINKKNDHFIRELKLANFIES
ncbi:MAG: hypothetical protein HFG15_04985 [Bacilli bacterium]|jgi:hypothetical protein|nr:hypothetical protein [Bacilli bacterium]